MLLLMRRGSGEPTRDRILQATIDLVSDRNSATVSVQDIVEHAGVTKGAFYHHFDSKQAVLAEALPRLEESEPERPGDLTREAIIAAAVTLFAERGFAATSVQDIVAQAGVTKGAFYHHFDSKNSVFLEIYSILPNHFLRTAREISSTDLPAGEALLRIIEAVANLVKDFRAETTVWIGELRMMRDTDALDPQRLLDINALTAELIELISAILRRGVDSGEFHEIDDLQAVAFTVVSVPVLVYSWLDVDRPVDPARVTQLFADLFLRGLFRQPVPSGPSNRARRSRRS
jgi:TetR/AcrR family transcriptional regulator, cholesterol catabolism regulator